MIDPTSVSRHTLPNGLTLLVRADRSAPVAAVVTYVKAGYFDETDDMVGIAHVLEHMFFKGTPRRGVGEIARETKANGGYLNAHTIYDHTSYFAVLPTDGFLRGLEVQADAYANSLIDAAELAKELEVIIQEAKRKLDSPGAVAVETLYQLLHDRHRIRRWRIGREEELRTFTRAKLAAFYRNFYQPANTILSIVGDFDEDRIVRRVEELYGSLNGGTPARSPGERETDSPGFRYRELTGDIAQAHMVFGWQSPPAMHDDTPALDIFALVLGVGRGSRLYQQVRERKLVSSVSAWNYTPTEIGVFGMDAEGNPERAGEALEEMWGQLRQARDGGFTSEEVVRAQRLFEARWLRRIETMEGQATLLAEWEALGDWRLSESYFDRVMKGTADSAVEAARQYLSDGQASVLLYRPTGAPEFAADVHHARARLMAERSTTSRPAPITPRTEKRDVAAHQVAPGLERTIAGVHVFRSARDTPILVRRRAGSSMAHLGVYSAAGSARESDALAGLATITARSALKGTERRSAERIAYDAELLGASLSPSATSDGFGWTMSVPVTRIDEAIELLADIVQSPVFRPETIDTEREIALANLAELRDDMYRYPVRLATVAAYDGHPYGRGPLGSDETLGAIQSGDARDWHDRQVLAGPVTIAVVADGDERELAARVTRAFSRLEMRHQSSIAAPSWPAVVVERAEKRDKAQTALALAFEAPARHSPDRFAGQLLAVVASGLGGRFFEALRERRSLAYTVHAYPVERVGAGSFIAYIATSPAQEEAARTGLLGEFDRLRDEPVTEEELERAKVYALGSHAIAQQNGANVLWEMIDAWVLGTGLEELDEFATRVRQVTAGEIRDFARKYFDPGRRVEGIVRGTK